MKAIVKRAFQFRGGTARIGTVLNLSAADLADPFVAAHVDAMDDAKPAPAPYFGNGKPAPEPATGGLRDPEGDCGETRQPNTIASIRAELDRLGVHYTMRMTRAELAELLAKANDAVAGTPLGR